MGTNFGITQVIHSLHKAYSNTGFLGTVASIIDHNQVGFGPGAMEIPGCLHGAHQIIATLDNGAGDVTDPVYVLDDLAVFLEEAPVDKVVTAQGPNPLVSW